MTELLAEKVLIFEICGRVYSVPVSELESVISIKRSEISTIPFDTERRFIGITSVKGRAVGIIRSPGLIARAYTDGADSLTAIIIGYGKAQFLLIVDGVREVSEHLPDESVIALSARDIDGGNAHE